MNNFHVSSKIRRGNVFDEHLARQFESGEALFAAEERNVCFKSRWAFMNADTRTIFFLHFCLSMSIKRSKRMRYAMPGWKSGIIRVF